MHWVVGGEMLESPQYRSGPDMVEHQKHILGAGYSLRIMDCGAARRGFRVDWTLRLG